MALSRIETINKALESQSVKALSVKQPWASLLCEGVKTIEVRSWQTSHRGKLLICASSAPKNYFWHDEVDDENRLLPSGCIIGIVNLLDVRKMTKEDAEFALCDFSKDTYAWVTEPVAICRPDKIIGRLNLFDVDDNKIHQLIEPDWAWNYPPPQGNIKFTKSCQIF